MYVYFYVFYGLFLFICFSLFFVHFDIFNIYIYFFSIFRLGGGGLRRGAGAERPRAAGEALESVANCKDKSGNTLTQFTLKAAPRRAGDLPEYFAEPSKAKALLKWEAKRSLDEMCASSWAFQSRQAEG